MNCVRDTSVTDIPGACSACGRILATADPRRRYCSQACRQRGYRARQAYDPRFEPEAPTTRAQTVYQCSACGERLLGEQRCPDCQIFCHKIGLGGACPHCDEPVAVADLLDAPPQP